MKAFNLILAAIFLLFAFVQVNDPDPVLWILIYGVMAVVCVMAAFRYYHKRLLWALLISFVAYSFFYMPSIVEWLQDEDKARLFDEVAKMESVYIEETREFLGLFICILVLVLQLVRSRKIQISG